MGCFKIIKAQRELLWRKVRVRERERDGRRKNEGHSSFFFFLFFCFTFYQVLSTWKTKIIQIYLFFLISVYDIMHDVTNFYFSFFYFFFYLFFFGSFNLILDPEIFFSPILFDS